MLTIVSTTTGRPECFAILERWIARQTLQPDQWLVVGEDLNGYRFNRGQEVVCRPVKDGEVSILENWLSALALIRGDRIAVIEDDDWFHPGYLAFLSGLLEEFSLVGLTDAVYWKLRSRSFVRMHNKGHASLGATAFRSEVLPYVRRAIEVFCRPQRSPFIDMYLWAEASSLHGLSTRLVPNKAPDGRAWHVGLKQMPGKAGYGLGHHEGGSSDRGFAVLRQWIGSDVDVYRALAQAQQRDFGSPEIRN